MSPNPPVRLAIAGALGRMGQAVAKTAQGREDIAVAARFDRPGLDGEGLVSLADALAAAQVVIDFTTPDASVALAQAAAAKGAVALVIGSTGFSGDHEAAIRAASAKVAIVKVKRDRRWDVAKSVALVLLTSLLTLLVGCLLRAF